MIEKVINVVKQEDQEEQYILFWISKTSQERLAEVTRLRRNYYTWLNKTFPDKMEKVVSKRRI